MDNSQSDHRRANHCIGFIRIIDTSSKRQSVSSWKFRSIGGPWQEFSGWFHQMGLFWSVGGGRWYAI
jgi:hypothetical protein